MSNYARGRQAEYKTAHHMAEHGWLQAFRGAGSKGAADLHMVHPIHGQAFVEVKTGSGRMTVDGRDRLLYFAGLCGALPILARVVPREPVLFTRLDTNERWTP